MEVFEKGFPEAMKDIVLGVADKIPRRNYSNVSIIASSGSTAYHLGNSLIFIPYRVYLLEVPEIDIAKMSGTEQTILHCIYSRSCDGYVREKHIKRLLSSELPAWAIPYVFKVCDEYVIEILQAVYDHLKEKDTENIKQFCANNRAAFCKSYNRMISYWNVYYREDCTTFRKYVGRKLFIECFGAKRTMSFTNV